MIEVTLKSKGCGCEACVQACPKMCISLKEDEEGFLYPHVDKDICINCGICEKGFPVIHQHENATAKEIAYAAINKDEAIRIESSSGGVFIIFASQIIEDGGVVFGVAFDKDFQGEAKEFLQDYYKSSRKDVSCMVGYV